MIYSITPVAKPRMTRRDKWAKRPAVLKYFAFCEECRLKMPGTTLDNTHVIFHVPMPKSWSKAKKVKMNTRPHRQTPDLDNFCKSVLDALYQDDSCVADISLSKRWAYAGAIAIT